MSIESKIPQGEINIQSLHLEKPERAENADFFDASKEIAPEIWQKMATTRDKLLAEGEPDWVAYGKMTFEMRLLKPDFPVELDEIMHASRTQEDVQNYFHGQVSGIDLDSVHKEKYRQLQVDLFWHQADGKKAQNTANANEITDLLRYCRAMPHFHAYMRTAKAARQLFPQEFQNFEFANEVIESYQADLTDKLWPVELSEYGTFLKLCSKKFELPRGLYKKSMAELDKFAQINDWKDYAELAAALKIMTAEKVTITDAGMQLEMPGTTTHIAEAQSPLPEVKKF